MRNPRVEDYRKVLADGMRRSLLALTRANKKIIVVLDNPPLPFDPKSCVARPFRLSERGDRCSFPREKFDSERAYVEYKLTVMEVVNDFPNVKVIDLSTRLCDEKRCYLARDGKLLYLDEGHLNEDGSRYVAPYVIDAIENMN